MTHPKIAFLLAAIMLAAIARAQSNYALDNTFGNAGTFTGPPTGGEGIYPLWSASQADGKIIVGGAFYNENTGIFDSACVFRLKTNGTPDSTFGTRGYARVAFTDAKACLCSVQELNNGKIVACGYSIGGTTSSPIFSAELAMLDATGHTDAGFNGGAPVVLAAGTATVPAYAFVMAEQSTGQIVIGATIGTQPDPASTVKIFRYNANGTPDAAFGIAGSITITPGYTDQLFVDGNDRIMTDWSDGSASGNVAKAILRFTANGQPDPAWGSAGKSDTIMENTTSNNAYSMSITPLANGKFALSSLGVPGSAVPATQTYVTRLFTSAGHLASAYGTGGKAVLSVTGFDRATDYYTVANGNKVIAMLDLPSTTIQGTRDFVLMQIDTAGNLDGTFGTGGMLRTPAGNSVPLALNKMTTGTLIAATDLVGSKGEVMRFKQTPTGIAIINGKMEAGVYPNPATAAVALRCESDVLYGLYDRAGREVLRGKTTATETVIDIRSLAAGVYSLVCTDGRRNAALNVVKR